MLLDSPAKVAEVIGAYEVHAVANAIKSWIQTCPQLAFPEYAANSLNTVHSGLRINISMLTNV